MGELSQGAQPLEPPRGMYPGRLDDKGRLKLPADLMAYLAGLTDKTLFVTSLDRRTAQIYPMLVWRDNEKFFESYTADPAAAEAVAFNANDLGGNTEMDGQGRVLFPPELRRELKLEGQALRLYTYRGHIEVLSESVYEELKRAAAEAARENALLLKRAGLK